MIQISKGGLALLLGYLFKVTNSDIFLSFSYFFFLDFSVLQDYQSRYVIWSEWYVVRVKS